MARDLMGRFVGSLTTSDVTGVLPVTFTQAALPPVSAALVTVPTSVALFRMVYGSISLTGDTSDSALIEVETAVASGAYDAVQEVLLNAADDLSKAPFSFVVAPGRRYRFTLTGTAEIVHYSYMDM